ncbi:hypothetical protein MRX96_028776 [Rhipicephalus microplus]
MSTGIKVRETAVGVDWTITWIHGGHLSKGQWSNVPVYPECLVIAVIKYTPACRCPVSKRAVHRRLSSSRPQEDLVIRHIPATLGIMLTASKAIRSRDRLRQQSSYGRIVWHLRTASLVTSSTLQLPLSKGLNLCSNL